MTTDFRALQAKNRRTTWIMLFCSFLLLLAVAMVVSYITVGGVVAAVLAVAIAGGTTFASYRSSDAIALRATRAQPADPQVHAQLHNLVEEMSIAAGLPKPRVYIVDDHAPNAFATGRSPEKAAIAATTGLIDKLDRNELQGVIAHEMAHIRNNDIRVMTVAVATAGAIALIADIFWRMMYFGGLSGGGRRRSNNDDNGAAALLAIAGFIFVAVLAPLAASLLRAAVSRSREGLADASAVELTRNPEGLRMALEKLDADVTVIRHTSHATSHLWIEGPDDRERDHKGRRFNDMFNTHPPLQERIDSLRQMEGLSPYTGPSDELVAKLQARQQRQPAAAAGAASVPGSWAAIASSADTSVAATAAATTGSDAPGDPAPGLPKAGWYEDPTGSNRARWWDGKNWTSFTS